MEQAASVGELRMKIYHHSSRTNRDSILKLGLLCACSEAAQMGGHGCLFFTTNPRPTSHIDCWEIDTNLMSGNGLYHTVVQRGIVVYDIHRDVAPQYLKLKAANAGESGL